jgi:hypothetical protein
MSLSSGPVTMTERRSRRSLQDLNLVRRIQPVRAKPDVSTYWFTGTAGSAAQLYKEAAAHWAAWPGYCEVPTARGLPRRLNDPQVR